MTHDNIFVNFEGIDASGKTTLLQAVEHACNEAGIGVQTTAEPSETDVTEFIDDDQPAIVQTLLFTADRYLHQDSCLYHCSEPIENGNGSVVLCDRHYDSTLAYQVPQLVDELDWSIGDASKWVRSLHEGWVRQPDSADSGPPESDGLRRLNPSDITVFVDTSPSVARERSLYEDDFEDEQLLERAYEMYQEMYEPVSGYDNFVRADGEQPRGEMIDEGVEQIMSVIESEI